ncbi:MAG: UDP-glucose/GDP-mannose dehydrogenase family protein [Chloroflexi bacterium]|nr:UDP-glucose/GDP-mannose dehydrogenase family protein [Chloroflexota bacterium]
MSKASRSSDSTRICALGLWHLGCVTSACLARLGYRVTAYDPDAARVRDLMGGTPPLYEPGLSELIAEGLASGRLTFTDDLAQATGGAAFVLFTFDTPVDDQDQADIGGILTAAADIAPLLGERATVIVMSQVPAGTCRRIAVSLQQADPGRRVRLVYSPENLKLGRAIDRFLRPPMVVLGADDEEALDAAEQLFAPIAAPKLRLNLPTAEMLKHALNAFSATCISFANEIAALCDEAGADAVAVADAMRYDERVGLETPLRPGLGFAGGTLARDLNALRAVGDRAQRDTPLLDAVHAINEGQKQRVLDKLHGVYGSLDGLTVSVFGLTYKPGTSTLRRSLSLELIDALAGQGTSVKAYDPMADIRELPAGFPARIGDDPYETARDSDALLILTGWPDFRDLDYAAIRLFMRQPVLIDALNLLDREALLGYGFRYLGIGR